MKTDCSNLKPGDRAMLVGTRGYGRLHHVEQVDVAKIHKTGHIVLTNGDRYRPSGTKTGQSQYSISVTLQPWDESLWQQFQQERAQARLQSDLFKLGGLFQTIGRGSKPENVQRAAEIWESLPFEIRQLIEGGKA